jgi:peptide/nickel transport system ATP-binding protein
MSAVLEVEGLSVDYRTRGSTVRALDRVNLAVEAGETVGVIGESGSGKSTLAYAIARYLPGNARLPEGRIRISGTDMATADAAALRHIRRSALGMVYQNAAAALNPTQRIGRQLIEAVTVTGTPAARAGARSRDLLAQVQLRDPHAIMDRFPHQTSGGERQRVLIAMAIAGNPRLLLLDEPTTALDPETARGILDLIAELRDRLGAAVLYISHDLDTVSRLTDRLLILRAGVVVEEGTTRAVLATPRHDYTRLLLASRPAQLAQDGAIAEEFDAKMFVEKSIAAE